MCREGGEAQGLDSWFLPNKPRCLPSHIPFVFKRHEKPLHVSAVYVQIPATVQTFAPEFPAMLTLQRAKQGKQKPGVSHLVPR